jgi:DGQHR domain-containing protein
MAKASKKIPEPVPENYRFSVSQITQGRHRFYTLTMPSDILAKCCFVSTRDEDPSQGFQRVLDKKRAESIAQYVDSGFGTIPSSIVLSAQPDAELAIIGRGKTLQFNATSRAFLILDGQHRVYGFSLAKSSLRVPVVIYNGLSRRDESRLFIDINSKQKGVPNELLLDIKSLAEYESDSEQALREIFDALQSDINSAIYGRLSPSARSSTKISRVTFNSAAKPLLSLFQAKTNEEVYETLNAYLTAFVGGLEQIGASETLVNAVVFKAIMAFFPSVAARVKDRYGAKYSAGNFSEVLDPMFSKLKASKLSRPGQSYLVLIEHFEACIRTNFTL